jgi:hypothetical protein
MINNPQRSLWEIFEVQAQRKQKFYEISFLQKSLTISSMQIDFSYHLSIYRIDCDTNINKESYQGPNGI